MNDEKRTNELPYILARLRHLYDNLVNGKGLSKAQAESIAKGLLSPAIKELEIYETNHSRV